MHDCKILFVTLCASGDHFHVEYASVNTMSIIATETKSTKKAIFKWLHLKESEVLAVYPHKPNIMRYEDKVILKK